MRPTRDRLEQFVQQALHACRGIDDPAMSARRRSKIARHRIFFQKAQETANGDERTLQIVRDGVREAFQLGVFFFQFFDHLLAFSLSLLANGHIARTKYRPGEFAVPG